jgi:hypothetical protein
MRLMYGVVVCGKRSASGRTWVVPEFRVLAG